MKQISVLRIMFTQKYFIMKLKNANILMNCHDLVDMFHLTVKNVSSVFKDDPRKDEYAIGNFKPELSNNPSIHFLNVAKNGFMKISNTKNS